MLITDESKINDYYKALVDREPSYVGIFYVGVKTTTVFCIATCRARKPKRENVVFYSSFKEALDAGYRPCKICKPTENTNQAPEPVEKAMKLVRDHPKEKISDDQLRQLHISPELVRRWFKKNYGMTFQAYQRMYRINSAFQELKAGKKAIDAAFESGYDSLSGFGYTYKKMVGKSPELSHNNAVILISRLTTVIGPMFICASDKGVCLLEFVDRRMLETEFKDLQKLLQANIIAGENKHIKQAKKEISEYFNGTRTTFDVALDTPGTEFQNSVWACLHSIGYAQTCSYQQQAQKINNPKAVRAVASANGCNRIAIIIPCHRVIGKNGKLTGYGGGLERKRWLIEHENKVISK
jgi:AraC family transcriptional regulator of adaptative response/methylated-DNA-[protein]-cysteine methyltransferase